jgi:hypothetical protein
MKTSRQMNEVQSNNGQEQQRPPYSPSLELKDWMRLSSNEGSFNFVHGVARINGKRVYVTFCDLDVSRKDAGKQTTDRRTGQVRVKATATVSMNGRTQFQIPDGNRILTVMHYIGDKGTMAAQDDGGGYDPFSDL